jgi:arsenate reductase
MHGTMESTSVLTRPSRRALARAMPSSGRSYNVLFLCEDNSARSLMAEVLLQHWGRGRFGTWSAGSRPAAAASPVALEVVSSALLPTTELHPKSWTQLCTGEAPQLDFVISVDPVIAAESWPTWRGLPVVAHWAIGNPAAVRGGPEETRRAYQRAYRDIEARIKLFVSLPLVSLDLLTLRGELRKLE